jgi:large subunit ribosomal protein L6
MSRVGKQPVKVPAGVKVELGAGTFRAEGPKGTLEQALHGEIEVKYDKAAGEVRLARPSDSKKHKSLQGLMQRLVANAVFGVSQGFEKKLQIIGIGYSAKLVGGKLTLAVGFANQVEVEIPKDIKVEVPQPTLIVVKGCDRQKVGQFASEIRGVKPPEPYKGKGIRYDGEYVRRKAGKAFVGSGQ